MIDLPFSLQVIQDQKSLEELKLLFVFIRSDHNCYWQN